MILDGLLLFTGTSNGATSTIADASYTDAPTTGTQTSSNVVDLGLSGIPTSANGGGARDIAVGNVLRLLAVVTAAFAGGTSLQLVLAGAPDNGSGGQGSFTTMWTSEAIAEADLVAGAYLANIDVPRPQSGQVMPRFLRLSFVTSGTHTSGSVLASIVLDRFDQPAVDGVLSGYPAGINIAN